MLSEFRTGGRWHDQIWLIFSSMPDWCTAQFVREYCLCWWYIVDSDKCFRCSGRNDLDSVGIQTGG